jgi:RNA polymerase primary sigma factor
VAASPAPLSPPVPASGRPGNAEDLGRRHPLPAPAHTCQPVLPTSVSGSGASSEQGSSGDAAGRRRRRRPRSLTLRTRTEGAAYPGDDINTLDGGSADRDVVAGPLGDSLAWYLRQIGRYELLSADEERELARSVEAGRLAEKRLARLGDHPIEDRSALEGQVERGQRAGARFVESNLRLVVSVALRYATPSFPLSDCIQEGNLGLIKAVERFDWRRGYRFSTYATWWIRQAIIRALTDKARTIRVPTHVAHKVFRVRQASAQLVSELGRPASVGDVASACDMTTHEVVDALRIADGPVSIHHPIGQDGSELADVIEDEEETDPAEAVDRMLTDAALREALASLSAQERSVIMLRFGFDTGVARTLADVAEQLDLKPQGVREFEARAIAKLRCSGLARSFDVV